MALTGAATTCRRARVGGRVSVTIYCTPGARSHTRAEEVGSTSTREERCSGSAETRRSLFECVQTSTRVGCVQTSKTKSVLKEREKHGLCANLDKLKRNVEREQRSRHPHSRAENLAAACCVMHIIPDACIEQLLAELKIQQQRTGTKPVHGRLHHYRYVLLRDAPLICSVVRFDGQSGSSTITGTA